MKLFEHPEFEQALVRAAERYQFSEQFIEKDYWITQILNIVAKELGDHVIFKGGTPALFPDPELRETLARAYHVSCPPLFASRDFPQFDEILARFAEVRALL